MVDAANRGHRSVLNSAPDTSHVPKTQSIRKLTVMVETGLKTIFSSKHIF